MNKESGDANPLGGLLPPIATTDDDRFQRVVQVLEGASGHPEIQEALNELRPRIVRLRPPRRTSVQRVLYLPIEDLLTARSDAAGCGLVRRAAASLAVNYLKKQVDDTPWSQVDEMLKDVATTDRERLTEVGHVLWPWAAGVLAPAVTDALTQRRAGRDLLGESRELLPDLRQFVQFLELADEIQALKDLLPLKPVGRLTPEMQDSTERLIRKAHQGDPERLYTMLLTIMLRMAIPGEFFEYAPYYFYGFDAETKTSILSRLALIVLSDMNWRTAELASLSDGDPEQRASSASTLVTALTTAERSTRRHDPATKMELAVLRRRASAVVQEVVADAAKRITVGRDGASSLEERRSAEKNMSALRRVQIFADKVAMRATVDDVIETAATQALTRAATALKSASESVGSGTDLSPQRDDVVAAIRILELAGRIDDAEKLRRSARSLLQV